MRMMQVVGFETNTYLINCGNLFNHKVIEQIKKLKITCVHVRVYV
jgi:hypothetical protein